MRRTVTRNIDRTLGLELPRDLPVEEQDIVQYMKKPPKEEANCKFFLLFFCCPKVCKIKQVERRVWAIYKPKKAMKYILYLDIGFFTLNVITDITMIVIGAAVYMVFIVIVETTMSICFIIWLIINILNRKDDAKTGNAYHSMALWNCIRLVGLVIYSMRYLLFTAVYISWMSSVPVEYTERNTEEEIQSKIMIWFFVQPPFIIWNIWLYVLMYTGTLIVKQYKIKFAIVQELQNRLKNIKNDPNYDDRQVNIRGQRAQNREALDESQDAMNPQQSNRRSNRNRRRNRQENNTVQAERLETNNRRDQVIIPLQQSPRELNQNNRNNNNRTPRINRNSTNNNNNTRNTQNNERENLNVQPETNLNDLEEDESYEYVSVDEDEQDEEGNAKVVKGKPITVHKTNIHYKQRNADGEIDFSLVQIQRSVIKADSKSKNNNPVPKFPSMSNVDLACIKPVKINKEKIRQPETRKRNIDITSGNKQKKIRTRSKKQQKKTTDSDASFHSRATVKRPKSIAGNKNESNTTSITENKNLKESIVIAQSKGAPSNCSIRLCADGESNDTYSLNNPLRRNRKVVKTKTANISPRKDTRNDTKASSNKKSHYSTKQETVSNSNSLNSEKIDESSVIAHEKIDDSSSESSSED